MIIKVNSSLNGLKEYLINRGYSVIDEYSSDNNHDVFIYSSTSYEGLYSNLFNNNMNGSDACIHGTLLINAHNKTPEEIEDIIHKRKYGSLFESEGLF